MVATQSPFSLLLGVRGFLRSSAPFSGTGSESPVSANRSSDVVMAVRWTASLSGLSALTEIAPAPSDQSVRPGADYLSRNPRMCGSPVLRDRATHLLGISSSACIRGMERRIDIQCRKLHTEGKREHGLGDNTK